MKYEIITAFNRLSQDEQQLVIKHRDCNKKLLNKGELYTVEHLFERSILIKDEDSSCRIRWIDDYELHSEDNHIQISFNKSVIPYLPELKIMPRLTSKHAVTVYERLLEDGDFEISLSDLRNILGIHGDEYERFYDFKRVVLDIIKKQINDTTNMTIEYQVIKPVHRVESIRFIAFNVSSG